MNCPECHKNRDYELCTLCKSCTNCCACNETTISVKDTTDTDCILSELSGRIEYLILLEQQAKAKAVQCALAQETFKWLKRTIENAAKGDHVEHLASQLGSLQAGEYLNEGLESLWVPYHIVNHAIVLCKQAIASTHFEAMDRKERRRGR